MQPKQEQPKAYMSCIPLDRGPSRTTWPPTWLQRNDETHANNLQDLQDHERSESDAATLREVCHVAVEGGDTVAPCRRCRSRTYRDVSIHDGQSVRRDCGRCGRFIGFTVWYGTDNEVATTTPPYGIVEGVSSVKPFATRAHTFKSTRKACLTSSRISVQL
jgi:hypothetical protein